MNDDVLLKFVTKNLINVGGDDTKLERIRQAAGDLSEILKKTPAKALSFSLAAFDPEVPESEPAVVEATDALQRRWETYVNTFASTPVAVCRAMLMDAMIRASCDNEAIAVVFATCARNVLPFMEVGGEQEIWANVVAEIERKVEKRAEAEWATPSSIDLPKIKLNPIAPTEIRVSGEKVDRDNLSQNLWAATGPYYITSQDGQNQPTQGNPHWPTEEGNWVSEFGTRAADAVGEAIDGITDNLSVEEAGSSEATRKLAAAISAHLDKTVQAVSLATMGLQRRTSLLWWKEALFSPSIKKSYREIPIFTAAALMAFDLHRQIPTFSPGSITAFLRETVIALPNVDGNRKFAIRELAENSSRSCVLSELRTEAARLVMYPVGRGLLLGLIGNPQILTQIDDSEFRNLVGVKPNTELSLPDWSVWLLREFHAARTIAEASVPKRRATPRKRTSRN